MLEIFQFLLSIFGGIFNFFNDFKIYKDLSFFHLIVIIIIFSIILKFVFNDKEKK